MTTPSNMISICEGSEKWFLPKFSYWTILSQDLSLLLGNTWAQVGLHSYSVRAETGLSIVVHSLENCWLYIVIL